MKFWISRFIDRGVPVILGEYGATSRTGVSGADRYRSYWDQYITYSAYQRGLVPIYWDSGATGDNTTGMFDRSTGVQVYPSVISAIVDAAK